MVHRNFQQTEEMVNNLIDMNSKLDVLEDLLTEDSSDILGPAPSLLYIHHQLTQLEAFRNQTMHLSKKAKPSSRSTLLQYFERLNTFVEAFDEYIIGLARNILHLVRAGHPEVIVKLIKIAEVEGREDEKVRTHDGCVLLFNLTASYVGHCHSPSQEGCQNGRSLQIQIHAS